ncbi:hypothetical protein CLF_110394 [Clonorchis sinensis]|uniref:Uncharacterized protein n=1 Tax=Clonorchis sinensis TaxID=79923 RepID=G7YKM4_CLOSI|nr:hypothetical protein CLF_110394 [Clonorchis sinensis]
MPRSAAEREHFVLVLFSVENKPQCSLCFLLRHIAYSERWIYAPMLVQNLDDSRARFCCGAKNIQRNSSSSSLQSDIWNMTLHTVSCKLTVISMVRGKLCFDSGKAGEVIVVVTTAVYGWLLKTLRQPTTTFALHVDSLPVNLMFYLNLDSTKFDKYSQLHGNLVFPRKGREVRNTRRIFLPDVTFLCSIVSYAGLRRKCSVPRTPDKVATVVRFMPDAGWLRWLVLVLCMPKDRLPHRTRFCQPCAEWKRPSGGQCMTWQRSRETLTRVLDVTTIGTLGTAIKRHLLQLFDGAADKFRGTV